MVHTTLVERYRDEIARTVSVQLSLCPDDAAYRIQRAWVSRKRRNTFRFIKKALTQAEESITRRVLQSINPTEAHLLHDPSLRSRVRFRLGGAKWPPVILYKIYTNATVHYIDGKHMVDHIHGHLDKRGVYNRRDYQRFISWLDTKPVRTGGRGNTWRPLFYTPNLENRLALPADRAEQGGRNRRNRLSSSRSTRSNMQRSLPQLGTTGDLVRHGAGGGISAGSTHIRFTVSSSAGYTTNGRSPARTSSLTAHAHQPGSTARAAPRWEMSAPRRRPGTTTELGRRIQREGIPRHKGVAKTALTARPKSAGRSRHRGQGHSRPQSAGYVRPRSINRAMTARKKRNGLMLSGTELQSTSPAQMGEQGRPVRHTPGTGHIRRGASGKKSTRSLSKSGGNTFSMKSVTSWDTIPPDTEVNELYAWSSALDDRDIDQLNWVKTSPSRQ